MDWKKKIKKDLQKLYKEYFHNAWPQVADAAKSLKERLKSKISGDRNLLLIYKELSRTDPPGQYVALGVSLVSLVFSFLAGAGQLTLLSSSAEGSWRVVFEICAVAAVLAATVIITIVYLVCLLRELSRSFGYKIVFGLLEEIEKELVQEEEEKKETNGDDTSAMKE